MRGLVTPTGGGILRARGGSSKSALFAQVKVLYSPRTRR